MHHHHRVVACFCFLEANTVYTFCFPTFHLFSILYDQTLTPAMRWNVYQDIVSLTVWNITKIQVFSLSQYGRAHSRSLPSPTKRPQHERSTREKWHESIRHPLISVKGRKLSEPGKLWRRAAGLSWVALGLTRHCCVSLSRREDSAAELPRYRGATHGTQQRGESDNSVWIATSKTLQSRNTKHNRFHIDKTWSHKKTQSL